MKTKSVLSFQLWKLSSPVMVSKFRNFVYKIHIRWIKEEIQPQNWKVFSLIPIEFDHKSQKDETFMVRLD